MPLNYPGSQFEGLIGLSEKYRQLVSPAGLFPNLALSSGIVQAMQITNPYRELHERIQALLPKTPDFSGMLAATQYAQSISKQLQSLLALARPFAQSDLAALALKNPLSEWAKAQQNLAALNKPLGDWAKLQQNTLGGLPLVALQQHNTQLTALGKQLAQSFSGVQHIIDWAQTSRSALSPAAWSTQLLDWADNFDAAFAELDDQAEYNLAPEQEVVDTPSMVDSLAPLSEQLGTLEVTTAADVAALRTYLEELYITLATAVSMATSYLMRNGKVGIAGVLLYAGSWSGFQFLIGLPATIDFYLQKLDTRLHPEHAAATKEDLTQLKADIIASIKQQAAEQGQLRTVARRLRVRVKPTEQSTCLGTIEAGQQVVVLKMKGKRAYVSYQDIDQLPMHGWVLKKYLRASLHVSAR